MGLMTVDEAAELEGLYLIEKGGAPTLKGWAWRHDLLMAEAEALRAQGACRDCVCFDCVCPDV